MQDFLDSTNFTSIFISLVVFKFLLETYLKIRNISSIQKNKNKIKSRSTFEDGYLALKLANAAYKSLKFKKTIKIK